MNPHSRKCIRQVSMHFDVDQLDRLDAHVSAKQSRAKLIREAIEHYLAEILESDAGKTDDLF